MHDAPKVLVGAACFVLLVASPFLYDLASGAGPAPALERPRDARECIEPAQTMRESHADLLAEWRDQAVRQGARMDRPAGPGDATERSLTRTCLSCHRDKARFCDACHGYVGTSPDCFSCHLEPQGGFARAGAWYGVGDARAAGPGCD